MSSAAASGDSRALLRSSPDVDVSSVGDRAVLYHRGTKQALVLNPSGSLLWSLLAAGSTEPALAAALVASHRGLGQERAAADAAAFLAELERHQMLAAAR